MGVPIKPIADYVVAEQEEAATKTVSGLYLPEKSQEKPKVAKILAVGSEVRNIKVGERVIYREDYENTKIDMGKDSYLLIREKNIIATVN